MTALRAWVNRLRRRVWRLLFFRVLFGERGGGRLLAGTRSNSHGPAASSTPISTSAGTASSAITCRTSRRASAGPAAARRGYSACDTALPTSVAGTFR